MYVINLSLPCDQATALGRLLDRLDEAACTQFAGAFITYGRDHRLEAAVMADAARALSRALEHAGRH